MEKSTRIFHRVTEINAAQHIEQTMIDLLSMAFHAVNRSSHREILFIFFLQKKYGLFGKSVML